MSKAVIPTFDLDRREQEISLILQLLGVKIDEIKHSIEVSQEFHPQKIRTSLTSDIEKTIENPIASIVELRLSLDTSILRLIDNLFKIFFKEHHKLLKEVYRSTCATNENRLLYYVVLNNDSDENREKVFEVLDDYEKIEFSSIFPAHFQFIPPELSNKIENATKISI